MTDTPYDAVFFEAMGRWATTSAQVIVPMIMELLAPKSVLDVGCGQGVWLRTFEDAGVERILGVDGMHVDRDRLKIRPDQFLAMDLQYPRPAGGGFDLAVCLEVAEHLPPSAGPGLVELLTRAAPVVLFSAAIPGQGGNDHLNEQWPEYWRKEFGAWSYRFLDPIRDRVWGDQRVEWFYRQNTMMFASEGALTAKPRLKRYCRSEDEPCLEWVHRSVMGDSRESIPGRTLCQLLIKRITRRLQRRRK